MGLTLFCKISSTFILNVEIFHGILSVPQNIVIDLNNIMATLIIYPHQTYNYLANRVDGLCNQ